MPVQHGFNCCFCLRVLPVRRDGTAYNADSLPGPFPSASALRRDFSAFGRNWAIGGLSGVFSFAHVRGMGYGKAVVLRATELLEGRGLDAGLFCCDRENVGFYRSCGWELLPGHPILVGNPPAPDPSATMFRAFSPDGAELRDRLAGGTLEFGDYVW